MSVQYEVRASDPEGRPDHSNLEAVYAEDKLEAAKSYAKHLSETFGERAWVERVETVTVYTVRDRVELESVLDGVGIVRFPK